MCAAQPRKEECTPKGVTEVPGDAERLRPLLDLAQKLLVRINGRNEFKWKNE